MDRSTRNLSIITLLVLAIFLALDHIARRAPLADWWVVLLFLIFALGIWFYDRISRRGVDDSEASETVIEPLVYDHHAAPIAIPDTIQAAAPVVVAAPVVSSPPAPARVTPPVEEKAAPAPPTPAPKAQPQPTAQVPVSKVAKPEPAPAPAAEVPPPAAPAKAPQPTSRGKDKPAAASAQPDDLKVVEGIGPKMEKALNAAGITTFAQLAASTEEHINAAIVAAGMRFAPSVPTWAEQASYAAKGDFAGLKTFQKTLIGGRKAK